METFGDSGQDSIRKHWPLAKEKGVRTSDVQHFFHSLYPKVQHRFGGDTRMEVGNLEIETGML